MKPPSFSSFVTLKNEEKMREETKEIGMWGTIIQKLTESLNGRIVWKESGYIYFLLRAPKAVAKKHEQRPSGALRMHESL